MGVPRWRTAGLHMVGKNTTTISRFTKPELVVREKNVHLDSRIALSIMVERTYVAKRRLKMIWEPFIDKTTHWPNVSLTTRILFWNLKIKLLQMKTGLTYFRSVLYINRWHDISAPVSKIWNSYAILWIENHATLRSTNFWGFISPIIIFTLNLYIR